MYLFFTYTMNDELLKLETLEKEYDATLQLYQVALNNYIDALKSTSTNPCSGFSPSSTGISQACYDKVWQDQGCITAAKPVTDSRIKDQTLAQLVQDSFLWSTLEDDDHRKGCYNTTTPTNPNTRTSALYPITIDFAELKGRSWWGNNSLDEKPVNTKEECEALCSSNSQCSGATFNPVRKYCWTRTGDGKLTTGDPNNIALISKQKAALEELKAINKILLDLNDRIQEAIRKLKPYTEQVQEENDEKHNQLIIAYDKLWEQRIEMEKQLQDYLTISNEKTSSGLETDSGRVTYKFWALFAMILFIITLKSMIGGESLPANVLFWIVMFILLIIMSFNLTTVSGFTMWFGFIIIIVLMRTGFLPSV